MLQWLLFDNISWLQHMCTINWNEQDENLKVNNFYPCEKLV
jgi:hypothetical protein